MLMNMRTVLLLLAGVGCAADSTELAEIRDASMALQIWDCTSPNVPVNCSSPFMARMSIAGDGIGWRASPPCVTLSDDVRATIDGAVMQNVLLGGEFEDECEGVVFLHDWSTRPLDLPTSRVAVTDGTATLAMDVAGLFGERRIDIITPTTGLRRGDHVEAELVLPDANDTITPGSISVCDGDCPAYLPFTITGMRIAFDVPATAAGPIQIGANAAVPVERCEGATCSALASMSIAVPVASP